MTAETKPSVAHEYVPANLGHAQVVCKWCHGTPNENAVLGPNHCEQRAAKEPTPEQPEQDRAVVERLLREIKHSIGQARVLGNDWKRELLLISNLTDAAIAALTATPPAPQKLGKDTDDG